MAALTQFRGVAAATSTSGRQTVLGNKMTAGCVPFRGFGLTVREQRRAQRFQKIVRGGFLFDDDELPSGGGVATWGDDEEEREERYIPEWPNRLFIEETLGKFPEEAVASVEQARVLFSEGGYTYLDVRPALENEDIGKVKGSVNIPIVNSTRRYDPEQGKKVTKKTPNEDFIKQVEKRFPKKDTKLLVGCSNGTQYSLDALEALDEAGYENIVGLKGGFYAWFSVFDNKLGRRRTGEYAETYTHDGDSCGIHSSGAGFDRVDKIEAWVPPPDY